jgi:hypothetical protein
MSRKANVFSLSKSFMEGISPADWSVVMIASVASSVDLPLMILQKMHEAAMLGGGMMCYDALLRTVHGRSIACLLAALL